MKKVLSLLLVTGALAFTVTKSHAQVEVTYGPEIGGSISAIVEDGLVNYVGFDGQIGGASHIQIGRFFAIRPSVFYKTATFFDSEDSESKIWLNRVGANVPLMFSYHFNRGHKLYVGAGPSIMYAVNGKYKAYDDTQKQKIQFGSGVDDDMKPLDFGVNIKLGFQFAGGLSLGYYYNIGLTNLAPKTDWGNYKMKNMDVVGISIGWMFGGNSED